MNSRSTPALFAQIIVVIVACCPGNARAGSAGDDKSQRCVEVDIDGSIDGRLDCLNLQLRRLVEDRHGISAELDAASNSATAPAELGLFNQFGTAERLGANFGRSAFPERPPEPVYTLPFGPGPFGPGSVAK